MRLVMPFVITQLIVLSWVNFRAYLGSKLL